MKVLLVDDHPLFMDGLKQLLSARGIEVAAIARNGLEALDKVRACRPEVILMDIKMPHLDGIAATRLIKTEFPDAKILMLTMSENDEDLLEAIKSGASGYLLKSDDTDQFFELLFGSMRNESALSPSLAGRILREVTGGVPTRQSATDKLEKTEPLTDRQIQVLTLVASGLTYKEVGIKLFLTERTIKYHMGEIVARLHVDNRRQAIERTRQMSLKRQHSRESN